MLVYDSESPKGHSDVIIGPAWYLCGLIYTGFLAFSLLLPEWWYVCEKSSWCIWVRDADFLSISVTSSALLDSRWILGHMESWDEGLPRIPAPQQSLLHMTSSLCLLCSQSPKERITCIPLATGFSLCDVGDARCGHQCWKVSENMWVAYDWLASI